jgi:hypothetical protein
MAESVTHLELVSQILSYIRSNYVGLRYVSTLHDLPGIIGCEKPPKIGDFRPDVYAIDAPLTRTIIGEAKTQSDLESDHSRRQFQAFLRFLRLQHNSVFILAVPWQVHSRARTLLRSIQKVVDASVVDILVLDNIRKK